MQRLTSKIVSKLRAGDVLLHVQGNDVLEKSYKRLSHVAHARAAGYRIAVSEDGSQLSLGHHSTWVDVYPAEALGVKP